MEWFDKEVEALEEQLAVGHITPKQFAEALRELQRDAKAQQDREDIIAAGRGHLLR